MNFASREQFEINFSKIDEKPNNIGQFRFLVRSFQFGFRIYLVTRKNFAIFR